MKLWQRIMGLSVNNRIAFFLRLCFLSICLFMALRGRPPAHAAQQNVRSVITSEDAAQDIALTRMGEFKTNQDNWNRDTGSKIGELDSRIRALESTQNDTKNEMRGWFSALTVLSILATIFQLKKKNTNV